MIAMDRNGVNGLSELESSASQSAGLLELWDGAGQSVWHHFSECGPGPPAGICGGEPGATLTRMVLRRQRQERPEAARAGGQHLFCSASAVGAAVAACQ